MLSLIATANFLIDPGNVYLKRIFNREVVDRYTDALLDSRFGVIQEGWNERDVKLSLAAKPYRDTCLVLGSSHIMNLSILRGEGLNRECPNLVNLGVSGATIEDIAIFSEVLIQHGLGSNGNRIYIGVSPWLFHFNKDARFIPYVEYYRAFLRRAQIRNYDRIAENSDYRFNWLSNLISADYFRQVIKLVRRDGLRHQVQQVMRVLDALNTPGEYVESYLVGRFEFARGSETAVTLSDGSHVYTSEFIQSEPDLEIGNYKLQPGQGIDESALYLFEQILIQLKENGFELVLLFTPYHHNLWEMPAGEPARKIMAENYSSVESLAAKLDLPLAGSYDPRVVGCDRDEFFDYMHPRPGCLGKIFISGNR